MGMNLILTAFIVTFGLTLVHSNMYNSSTTERPKDTERTKVDQLFEAAERDDLEAVKSFIEEKGVPVTADIELTRETLAHIAAKNTNLDMLTYLVDKAPSLLTKKDRKHNTVLRLVIERNATKLLEYVEGKYGHGLPKLSKHDFQSQALHAAIHYGHLDMVKQFIEDKNIDPNIRDEYEETPVFTAVEERQLPIFRYLVDERKADLTLLDRYNSNILFEFIRIDDLPSIKYVLDEKKVPLDVNWPNVFNDTIMHKAALFNRLNIIEYLVLEKKANVNALGDNGMTPLHHAAWKERHEVCKFLIEHGADARIKDEQQMTAAERTTDKPLVELLQNATTMRTRRSARPFFPSTENWRFSINTRQPFSR